MNLENKVLSIINSIPDPLLALSAAELGIQAIITQEEHQLQVNLSAGFPVKYLESIWIPTIEAALIQEFPNLKPNITLDHFIKAHTTQLPGRGLRGVKNTIAIASGKGGVGKSTVTVNLAIALARSGARVGILDADIYGPSIPLMLGRVDPIAISGDRYLPATAHGIQAMSIGYLTSSDDALIWRGPMLAKSLIQMLDITLWDELDYLLIDLPPGTGDIQLSLVQKIPLTGAIVVTTPQQVATLDAQKAIAMFNKTNIHVIGLIENMSLHTCTHCGYQDALFGHGGAEQLCQKNQCNLLGQLPLNSRIATHCDQGMPSATGHDELAKAFIQIATKAAVEVSTMPLNYANKFPPIVVE